MQVDFTKEITLDGVRAGIAYLENVIRMGAGYQPSTDARSNFLKDVDKDLSELNRKVKAMTGNTTQTNRPRTAKGNCNGIF